MDQPVADQLVIPEPQATLPRAPDGTFLPGYSYCPGGNSKGYAKPSVRLEHILNSSKVSEIKKKIEDDPSLLDSAVMRAAMDAADGKWNAINFIFDKLEPQSKGPAVSLNVNNSVSNQTAITVSDSMEMVEDALRIGENEDNKGSVSS